MIRFIGDGGHARAIQALLLGQEPQLDVTFVAVGDNAARKREAEAATGPFAKFIFGYNLDADAENIGEGTVIMPGAVVMPGARLGRHCIINTGATVDHDCVVEDYAHIAPGAHLCGGVHVGEGTLVGTGVCIEPNKSIPAWSIIKRAPYVIEPIRDH